LSQPRKRKRGRTAGATATATPPAPASPETPPPAGERPRRAKRAPVTNQEWMQVYAARGEARNAEAREHLVPLAPGERPWPILAGVGLCAAAAVLNLILWLAGTKIGGKPPSATEMLAFTLIMTICAVGMWVLWYQAVLAFMVLLAIVIVLFSLFLIEASNILGFVVAVAFIGGGGYLFWKLVGVLSRLQMPARPTRTAGR
jgi:hypothetical protein